MSEIKFRAWHKAFSCMFNVTSISFLCKSWNGVDILGRPVYSIPFKESILMQYTGLKDKNGKEIYENDIFIFDEHYKAICVIVFDDQNACFSTKQYDFRMGKDKKLHTLHSILEIIDIMKYEKIKIIGNIHENPELLEDN